MKILPTSLFLAFALASAPAVYAAGPKPAVAPKAPQVVIAPAVGLAPTAPQAAPAPPPASAIAPRAFVISPDVFEPLRRFDFDAPMAEVFDVAPMAELAELPELSEMPMMFSYAQQGDSKPDKSPSGTDPVYDAGLKAMDEARWSDAVKQFDKVAGGKSDRVEAALYRKTYSLEKLDRGDDAGAACEKLKSEKPNSRWNRDCTLLR